MKYYRIYNSTDPNKIGFFPQVHNALVDFDIYDKNSFYYLENSKSTKITLWPKLKISGRAKKTDFISSGFMGISIIVSEKLKSIIEKYIIEGVEFIKTRLVLRNNKEEQCWIINPYQTTLNFLDLNNTEFAYTNSMGSSIINQVSFNSTREYLNTLEKNKKDAIEIGYPNFKPLTISKVFFKDNYRVDFFSIDRVSGGYGFFVSENLKNEMEEAGCTGIVFTEPNERYP